MQENRTGSQTKIIAKHGLILAHLCVYFSFLVSIISLIIYGAVPDIASVALINGFGFFGAGIGCKAAKGFVMRSKKKGFRGDN
ncbi:hypothetical protein F0310_04495 (plasmid) [Borrelia sp. A-FGy1]|uniref:hypothetical protein n=1 Tax=Borrelia sp. A-FGy1 TaxID=2608247 RepID=UPI0015F782A8|nr:hypothetical protein [Borrelia sp. A-FGy1]QMU99677.1 hypothetical protein F0310_04495 [Borrelia sp. A-FGy1]